MLLKGGDKMKRLLKKKINLFGKEVSVMLIGLLAVVMVSAALIPYFGRIIGTVDVTQGLTLDGQNWNHEFTQYFDTLTSLEEKNVSSENHELKNGADVDAVVRLVTTCDEGESSNDGCENVVTTPVFKLSIPVATVANSVQDRVVANANVEVNDISTLSFDYMLTTTTTKYSPYFVLAFDTDEDDVADKWAVSLQDTADTANTWKTHGNGLVYHNVGTCTQSNLCDLTKLKTQLVNANLLQVKVMIGYWGDMTATTVLVKNLEVNGVDLVDNGLIIKQYDGSDPDDSENGDVIVDFSIETYFPQMMIPDTYTITTKVLPA